MVEFVVRKRMSKALISNFSRLHYRRIYAAADVHQKGELEHYVSKGEALGNMPVAYFTPDWWKATHGLDQGKYATAFESFLIDHADKAPSEAYQTIWQNSFSNDSEFQRVLAEDGRSPNGLMDFGFIKSQNIRNLAAPDPICLYLRMWGEGASVSPNRWFDATFYLVDNPDVARSGIEPFTHYITKGLFENRKPSVFLRPKIDASLYQDKTAFLRSIYSINELFDVDPPFELTRPDISQIGRLAQVHVPANFFFGEPAIGSTEDFELMFHVYQSYMEAQA